MVQNVPDPGKRPIPKPPFGSKGPNNCNSAEWDPKINPRVEINFFPGGAKLELGPSLGLN